MKSGERIYKEWKLFLVEKSKNSIFIVFPTKIILLLQHNRFL